MNAKEAYCYAKAAKKRIPGIERIIQKDARYSSYYVETMILDRCPDFEDTLRRVDFWWNRYLKFLYSRYYGREDKWKWIKEGLNRNLVEILNHIRMSLDMQEYICQTRPDLIGYIKRLRPSLKVKYQHELSFSKVDV